MKPSLPRKHEGSPNVSSSITPPNMAAGSIWRNPNSASSPPNVSTVASPTSQSSSRKSLPGRPIATSTTPRHSGTSQRTTPASNSAASTLNLNDSGDLG